MKAKVRVRGYLQKVKALIFIGFIILLLGFFAWEISPDWIPAAEAKEAEILLLHTNNVTGHLFPCPT